MRITILGCSGGVAADCRTTCLLLDDDILVDAGTGAGDLTLAAMLSINTVFLTHSHLDHVALLPMLADAVGQRRSVGRGTPQGIGQRRRTWTRATATLALLTARFTALLRWRNVARSRRRTMPLTVYALPETIAILKQDMFNFRLWPDYTAMPSPEKPYVRFEPVAIGQTVELSGRKITPLPVKHAVPGVAYQFDSGKASFVFSGDTTYHEPFWDALNAIDNLRYLMIEATFLNRNVAGAEASGHMRPELLAQGFKRLKQPMRRPLRILITHMEPGNENAIMAEILAVAAEFKPERLMRGQVFDL